MADHGSTDDVGEAVSGPELAKVRASAAGPLDERFARAWRAWLASLATDAEAATAAAHLYAVLPAHVRDAYLDALAEDAPRVAVPHAALYGPLLAVEEDPSRRDRICQQGDVRPHDSDHVSRALVGAGVGDCYVAVLVQPLYLDFVQVLVCQVARGRGFEAVHQSPLVRDGDAPQAGDRLEGVVLKTARASDVVDELAHAVVAHRRSGRALPRPLCRCADLFSPRRASARPVGE